MNHKRRRPKSARAGCLLCKPHKHQRVRKVPRSKKAIATLSDPVPRVVREDDESWSQIRREIEATP